LIDQAIILEAFEIDVPVIIRHASAEDLSRLEWDREMWAFRGIFWQCFDEAQQGRRAMLIADVSGSPVGRLFVQLAAGNLIYADGLTRAYLYSLHVIPPLQGRGIGTRLIQTAEHLLRERGFQWATIAVAQDNPRARRLYERLGYVIFRRDNSHWSYTDPDGEEHEVREACWALRKHLYSHSS
jgi:ribosomal protein S18 acetylase RimI-like enzyme